MLANLASPLRLKLWNVGKIMHAIQLLPVEGLPMIKPGDDLVALIIERMERQNLRLQAGDVLVLAQKVVSKSEGRLVNLRQIVPSERAEKIATIVQKDPRLVEVILGESNEVIWVSPNIFVVEDRNGFVAANAGVDRSNIEQTLADPTASPNIEGHNPVGDEWLALLPLDPNASARRIREAVRERTGADIAVIINDTYGRPFRMGGVGVALGAAGLQTLVDERGESDLFGYKLQATLVGTGDELASAASLLMGQAREATPAVIIRGYHFRLPAGADQGASTLVRPKEQDKFRYPTNRQIV